MKKHDYILNIEKEEKIYFSQMVLPLMEAPLNIFDRLKKVYVDIDHDKRKWRNIIFKSDIPFYLCLESEEDERYNGICYFNIEHLDKVNFYLTSITKKTK
jgi:hypothetical protein